MLTLHCLLAVAKALRRVAEEKAAAQAEACEWKRKYELERAHNLQLKRNGQLMIWCCVPHYPFSLCSLYTSLVYIVSTQQFYIIYCAVEFILSFMDIILSQILVFILNNMKNEKIFVRCKPQINGILCNLDIHVVVSLGDRQQMLINVHKYFRKLEKYLMRKRFCVINCICNYRNSLRDRFVFLGQFM